MKVKSNFFSQDEIMKIHEMSLDVLENVGIVMCDEYCREVFKKNGAKVSGEVVYIPPKMVEEAIKLAPPEFELYGRNGKSVKIGNDSCVMTASSGPLFVRRGNDRHRNTAQDYKNFQKMHHNSRVMDILNPNLIEPSDISEKIVRDYQMAVCLKYSDKPVMGLTTSPSHTINSIEMIQKFYGVKDNVMVGLINVISPLKYDDTMLNAVRLCAERRQPMLFACCSMPGATSPVTLSSTIVVDNAEVLAGIVYAQLLCPGIPCIYGNTSGGCDLRYVAPSIGAPETALFTFAAGALAEFYQVPCRTGGTLSDAKTVDWQAGVESMMVMLPSMMSSSNFILHAAGVMESYSTLSYEKFLLDEQNIEMIRKIVTGIEIKTDDEEMENIKEVGPGGQYIDADHTLDYMHEELYTPKLFNKMGYPSWEKSGSKDATELANEMIDKRIASYVPVECTKEQEDILRGYIGELYDTI